MHERPFVLRPLVDIDPELVHPTLECTVKELLERALADCGDEGEGGEGEGGSSAGELVLPMGVVRRWSTREGARGDREEYTQ